jgi:hypothetical protein
LTSPGFSEQIGQIVGGAEKGRRGQPGDRSKVSAEMGLVKIATSLCYLTHGESRNTLVHVQRLLYSEDTSQKFGTYTDVSLEGSLKC